MFHLLAYNYPSCSSQFHQRSKELPQTSAPCSLMRSDGIVSVMMDGEDSLHSIHAPVQWTLKLRFFNWVVFAVIYHSIIAEEAYAQNLLAHNVCIANSVAKYLALKCCKCPPLNFGSAVVWVGPPCNCSPCRMFVLGRVCITKHLSIL